MSGKSSAADVAGVRLTHPERVLYPDQGVSKRALAEFYRDIADWILPHVVQRPLSVVRCPRGRQQKCFYQKHLNESVPNAISGVEIDEKDGKGTYLMIKDLQGLIALAQMGGLEIHPWGCRADQVEKPDLLTFDLDPGESVGYKEVVEAAGTLRERLDRLGLHSFVKTTGGKGLHVVVPITRRSNWEQIKAFTKALVDDVVERNPGKFTASMSKAKRKGKIFIDYLRNSRGATSVAAYSPRARQGAPISTPVSWDELSVKLKPDAFNIENLRRRLASLNREPWQAFFEVRQSVTEAMKQQIGRNSF